MKGKKLRYYRELSHLTQEELARKCHVPTTYISKIENNKSEPSADLLEVLCVELNVTPDDLNKDVHSEKRHLLERLYSEIKARHTDKAQKTYSDVQAVFKNVEDPHALLHYHLIVFRYFMLVKDQEAAADRLNRIEKLKKYIDDELKYYYHKFSGLYEYLYGSLEHALNQYVKAKAVGEEFNIKQPELFYQIALVYSRLQKNAHSIMNVQQALQMFSNQMNYERCIDCNLLLGINFNILEDYDAAEGYFLKVIESADSHSKPDFVKSNCYHNLGHLYSKKEQHQQSVECLKTSLDFRPEKVKAGTYYLLAQEYIAMGEEAEAQSYVSKGLFCAEEYHDIRYKLKLNILEFQLSEQDNSEGFCEFLKQEALPFFRNRGDQFACRCSELLGKYYTNKSIYKESAYYFQLTNELRNKYKR